MKAIKRDHNTNVMTVKDSHIPESALVKMRENRTNGGKNLNICFVYKIEPKNCTTGLHITLTKP
ncbi:hypothetical protein PSY81_23500, partial [Shigella flexneri]|nr:hypothetical protein [Shigella flexneri]